MSSQVFGIKEGEVTPALRVATGWVFATVTGRQESVRAEAGRGQGEGCR